MGEHPELPMNYGGLDEEHSSLERARVVILPVPYDRTASYMKGTARGPEAIVEASRFMELYDDEIDRDPYTLGIHTAAPVSGTVSRFRAYDTDVVDEAEHEAVHRNDRAPAEAHF